MLPDILVYVMLCYTMLCWSKLVHIVSNLLQVCNAEVMPYDISNYGILHLLLEHIRTKHNKVYYVM